MSDQEVRVPEEQLASQRTRLIVLGIELVIPIQPDRNPTGLPQTIQEDTTGGVPKR
jgi:hypothetical protein